MILEKSLKMLCVLVVQDQTVSRYKLRHLLQDHLNYQKSTGNVKPMHDLIPLNQLLLQLMAVWLETI